MASVKERVLDMVEKLPDNVTFSEIMSELYFRLQVETGLKELDEGKGIPHDEVKKKASSWRSR